jgi:hypothetical protein
MFQVRGLPLTTVCALAARRRWQPQRVQHVFLCIADHWEPKWNRPSRDLELGRVARWGQEYPKLAHQYHDCLGRPPQHTFFYPIEEYEPHHLDCLAEVCRQGVGDVEVHLHHDCDTAENLRETVGQFKQTLHQRHGLLRKDSQGQVSYAFIHGNWALDNSRPDGRWCGVNNELTVLLETGCYADFTMPSAPDPCQTSTINGIYYAADDPLRPKSHDRGVAAAVGSHQAQESLLMIQGPLGLDWGRRKWGILPRLENGDLTERHPPTVERLMLWLQAGVQVSGRADWSFVKVHTHGAQEPNMKMLLGRPMHEFHRSLGQFAQEQNWFKYYYVTASQMASLVHAAEAGVTDPAEVLGS